MASLLVTIIWGFFIFIFLIVALIIGYNVWKKSFSYKVRIRRITADNTKVIRDAIGKPKKDKEKIPYLSVWFGFKKPLPTMMPIPPENAINFDANSGKLVVEALYSTDRGYTYLIDDNNPEKLKNSIDANKFGIFPTNNYEMMVNQIFKRDTRKTKSWTEFFIYATPFIALIMILTIFLIFFGKAVQPIQTMADTVGSRYSEIVATQEQTQKELNLMFKNIVHYQKGEELEGGSQVITSPEGNLVT